MGNSKGRQDVTDKLKESISALIDGEASEIEIHRLLRQLDGDSTLKASWINYLQARSVIQGERRITVAHHLELHRRISEAVQDEEAYALKSERHTPWIRTFAKPIAGLAVAASLTAAVVVGYYVQSPEVPGTVATASPATMSPAAINVQPVSTATTAQLEPQGQSLDLRQLNEAQQAQLREYLNMHDRMARMDPNARMVIYENPTTNP